MKAHETEKGGVLIGALLMGLLLAMLGGVAMNSAVTETTASARHLGEKSSQLLAESGVEQVMAWFTHGDLPLSGGAPAPVLFAGTADHPDVEYDAARPDDDRFLNDTGTDGSRALADLGRVVRVRLYGPSLPEGLCTVEVTAESRSGVRRTVSVELGALRIPPLQSAVQASPHSPWEYRRFKDLAIRFGTYYAPDRAGRLYRDGNMDSAPARTPAEVFGSQDIGHHRGLVFIDTIDQAPPSADNLTTLVLDSPYMEGVFYVNANVVLQPEGRSQGDGRPAVQGVFHATGSLQVTQPTRLSGAVVAEGGLTGDGLLDVQYDHDLGRGLVRGLPVVFPLRGSWREW
jgi:hypothetical protein